MDQQCFENALGNGLRPQNASIHAQNCPCGAFPRAFPRIFSKHVPTVSQAAIFHFSFWLGPGISYEMSLELVYGSDFRCVLHLFSSLIRSKGSWGQLWPKTGPKLQQTKMIIFPRGLTATKCLIHLLGLFLLWHSSQSLYNRRGLKGTLGTRVLIGF